ncbi:AaceriAEL114Cp [[Ashbya] aceris (nom. inval.)]|nr:AaceriAEL114Cp [[Ashbya] aceris (nom. inval.)]
MTQMSRGGDDTATITSNGCMEAEPLLALGEPIWFSRDESYYETSTGSLREEEYIKSNASTAVTDQRTLWQVHVQQDQSTTETEKCPLTQNIYFICFLICAGCGSASVLLTPTVTLSIDKVCEYLAPDGSTIGCDRTQVQEVLSNIDKKVSPIRGILCMLMSAWLGKLSDRIGRKPIFLYMGTVQLMYLGLWYVFYFRKAIPFSKSVMIFIQSFDALSGGVMTLLATGNSYISDFAPADMRTVYMTAITSVIYAVAGAGPLFSALFTRITQKYQSISFCVALACCGLYIAASLVIKEPRRKKRWADSDSGFHHQGLSLDRQYATFRGILKHQVISIINHVKGLFSPFRILWLQEGNGGSLLSRWAVMLLVLISLVFGPISQSLTSVLVLYAIYEYHWADERLGYFVSLLGISHAMFLWFSPRILRFMRRRHATDPSHLDRIDILCIRGSLWAGLAAAALLAVSRHESTIYLYGVVHAFSGLLYPTIDSALLKFAPPEATGELLGAMCMLISMSSMVFAPLFFSLYEYSVAYRPELFIYLGLIMMTLCTASGHFLKES